MFDKQLMKRNFHRARFRTGGAKGGRVRKLLVVVVTAQMDDDIRDRLADRQIRANGGCDGFLNKMNMLCSAMFGDFVKRAALDGGGVEWDAHDDVWFFESEAELFEDLLQQRLGAVKISDHAVSQWIRHFNMGRSLADHLFCLLADCHELVRLAVIGDRCWFVKQKPFRLAEQPDIHRP